ncbi:MAG: hypothetical protein ACYDEY_15210 [Acidimicrobiales bacterium]
MNKLLAPRGVVGTDQVVPASVVDTEKAREAPEEFPVDPTATQVVVDAHETEENPAPEAEAEAAREGNVVGTDQVAPASVVWVAMGIWVSEELEP